LGKIFPAKTFYLFCICFGEVLEMKNSFSLDKKVLDLFSIVAPKVRVSVCFRKASTFAVDEARAAMLEILYGFSPKEFDVKLETKLKTPVTFKLEREYFNTFCGKSVEFALDHEPYKLHTHIDITKISPPPEYFTEIHQSTLASFLREITDAIAAAEEKYVALGSSTRLRIIDDRAGAHKCFYETEIQANYGADYLASLVSKLKGARGLKFGIDSKKCLHAKFIVPPYHCKYWLAPMQLPKD
jgi:hypothetical protein